MKNKNIVIYNTPNILELEYIFDNMFILTKNNIYNLSYIKDMIASYYNLYKEDTCVIFYLDKNTYAISDFDTCMIVYPDIEIITQEPIDNLTKKNTNNNKNTINDTIYFAKMKDNAIIPTKRDEDGCYDIYACTDEEIVIEPHTVKLIPTGICTAFPKKYRISVRERGSNTKFTTVRAGQIDSGYRGEIFVALHNPSNNKVILCNEENVEKYQKRWYTTHSKSKAIAQIAVEFVPQISTKEISLEELQSIPSKRGFGKLGSSNK